MARMQHSMHIYLSCVSVNRMLILQLKIFLSVNLCFHFDSLCNISHFDSVDFGIIQMFTIFIATTSLTYVQLLLKIGY